MIITPSSGLIRVKIQQAGGKYGSFTCPFCGAEAEYKFSSGSGWCTSCGTSFTYTTESTTLRPAGECFRMALIVREELLKRGEEPGSLRELVALVCKISWMV